MRRYLAVLFLLPVAVFLLYRKSTRLWWTYDDPWFLHVAVERRWTEGFTHGDVWPQGLFTPLLTATYDALYALFGLDAERWYLAQIVLLAALALAVYALLRLYVDEVSAAGGALLFIASPPLASLATTLGVIHYVEAILLMVLATIAFVCRAKARPALSAISAGLYFLAMMAKEIAVPLPALLFLIEGRRLPAGRSTARWAALLPHAIALVAYASWRLAVIPFRGGYGWGVATDEWPRILATLPWKLITACTGVALVAGLVMLALTAIGISCALRTKRVVVLAVAGLFLLVAPILPVSKEMQDRYALAPWLWACAGFSIGVATLPLRWRNALIVAAVGAAVVANRQEWAKDFARHLRMSDEARVFASVGGNAVLRYPSIPPGTMPYLRWLKEGPLGRERGTLWFYDDIYLCGTPMEGKQVLEYEPRRREVVDVTARIPEIAKRHCSSIREGVPLRAEFRHRGQTLFWRFGPYGEGRYAIVLGRGEHAFAVPADASFRLGDLTAIDLRVRYDSPAGWVTYSPEIHLDFARQPDLTWHR